MTSHTALKALVELVEEVQKRVAKVSGFQHEAEEAFYDIALLIDSDRARELIALAKTDGWVAVSERLPEFNQRVQCWLVGVYEHGPGMLSPRDGMAELVRHRGETMLGEWGAVWYELALKKIDATHADVTHWREMPPIPRDTP